MKFAVKQVRTKTFAALLVAGLIPLVPQAEPISKEKGITMGSGAVIGAAVGGPFGFAVGAIAGGLLGDHADQTEQLINTEADMDRAALEIEQLERQVSQMGSAMTDMELDVAQLEEALLTRLEFQVLFRTGDDRLREEDRERVAMLAKYMRRNPEVSVRLQGHTDARGTEEYNAVLSEQRALAVANALIARGVSADRVKVESQGSSKAKAIPGDYEGYALDRHVNIEVVSKQQLLSLSDALPSELALAQ